MGGRSRGVMRAYPGLEQIVSRDIACKSGTVKCITKSCEPYIAPAGFTARDEFIQMDSRVQFSSIDILAAPGF